MSRLLGIIDTVARFTSEIVVGVSGKDSLAVLELVRPRFKRVSGFFQYLVPGLSFQDRWLDAVERRYGIGIVRLPHFQLSDLLRSASFRPHTRVSVQCPKISIGDVLSEVRTKTGIAWVATGEKKCDSLQRRGMLSRNGGIDLKNCRCFPLADWTNAGVFNFLRRAGVPLPPDYQMIGRSFDRLSGKQLIAIRDRYPNDYRKIIEVFPFAECAIVREQFTEVRRQDVAPIQSHERPIQPADA